METRAYSAAAQSGALVLSADGDEGFARGLAVSVHSTLTSLDPSLQPSLYILDGGVSDRTRQRMERLVGRVRPDIALHWVHLAESPLTVIPHNGRYPSVVYSRLLIPDLLPPEIKRVVYLDADLLVERDVGPLFDEDLREAPVAAVTDFGSGLELEPDARPYYNTGVLVFDLDLWRRTDLGKEVLAYVFSRDALRNVDQDAMNAVIDTWHQLDHAWNVQLGVLIPGTFHGPRAPEVVRTLLRSGRHGGIVRHFILAKPWIPSHVAPESRRWVVASLRTRWGTPLEELRWFLSWILGRLRYHVGTARLNLMRALRTQDR
jgi:lipopolysaccharide biosynthesis glycosyltransferase